MKNVALKRGISKRKKACGKFMVQATKQNERKDLAKLLHGVPTDLIPLELQFLVQVRGFTTSAIIPDLEDKVHSFLAQHLQYYANQLKDMNIEAIPKDLLFLLSPFPEKLVSIPFKSWGTLQRAIDFSTKGYFIIKYDNKRTTKANLKMKVRKNLCEKISKNGSRTRQQLDRINLPIVVDGEFKPVQSQLFNFIADCEKRCQENTVANIHLTFPLLLSTLDQCTDQQAHTDFRAIDLVNTINNNKFNAFDFPCSVIMALEDHTCLKVWV